MLQKINYEDDAFYLLLMAKRLHDGLKLDIDPEHFLDKIIDDIFFIDEVIGELYNSLRQSSLIHKPQYMRCIQRVKKILVDLIDDIIMRRVPMANYTDEFKENLTNIVEIHRRDVLEIRSFLSNFADETAENEQIVSDKELRFLFTNSEDKK